MQKITSSFLSKVATCVLIMTPGMGHAWTITEKWAALGLAVKYEKTTNSRDTRSVPGPEVQFGVATGQWCATLQLNQYSQSDSVGSISISSTNFQSVVALQYNFLSGEERRWDPFVFLGTGVFQNKITTTMGNTETIGYSEWNSLVKFGGGAWLYLQPRWRIGAELREAYSKNFNPEMVPEGALKFGLNF